MCAASLRHLKKVSSTFAVQGVATRKHSVACYLSFFVCVLPSIKRHSNLPSFVLLFKLGEKKRQQYATLPPFHCCRHISAPFFRTPTSKEKKGSIITHLHPLVPCLVAASGFPARRVGNGNVLGATLRHSVATLGTAAARHKMMHKNLGHEK